MNAHEVEVRLYNDTIQRLLQAYEECVQLINYEEGTVVTNDMRNSIVLSGVYTLDAIDKFKKYANRRYE